MNSPLRSGSLLIVTSLLAGCTFAQQARVVTCDSYAPIASAVIKFDTGHDLADENGFFHRDVRGADRSAEVTVSKAGYNSKRATLKPDVEEVVCLDKAPDDSPVPAPPNEPE